MNKGSARRGQAKPAVEFDPTAVPPEQAESSAVVDQLISLPEPGRPISQAEYNVLKELAGKPRRRRKSPKG